MNSPHEASQTESSSTGGLGSAATVYAGLIACSPNGNSSSSSSTSKLKTVNESDESEDSDPSVLLYETAKYLGDDSTQV